MDLPQLPRLLIAASNCAHIGRHEQGQSYAETAGELEANARYDSFANGFSQIMVANGYSYAGRVDRFLEIYKALAAQPGFAHVVGLCGLTTMLPVVGRAEDARAIAEETVKEARIHGNPSFVATALWGYGRAFEKTDPDRALRAWRQGVAYAREHRVHHFKALIAETPPSSRPSTGTWPVLDLLRDRNRTVPWCRHRSPPPKSIAPSKPPTRNANRDRSSRSSLMS